MHRTPLHRAVGKEHNEVVSLLLDKKADISMTDGGGLAPIHWAAIFGLVSTAEILCEHHANVDATTKSGETALHLSAEKGKVDFVNFLLQQGANKDVKDNTDGSFFLS